MPFNVKSELRPTLLKEVELVMIRGLTMSSLSRPRTGNGVPRRAFGGEVAQLWSADET